MKVAVKTLIIYAYYETPDSRRNLSFFCRHGISPYRDRHHVIVINGACSIEDQIPRFENVSVMKRENRGFDFGGWAHALRHTAYDQFDYFFFLNSSVTGPFLPSYQDSSSWPDLFTSMLSDKVKLAGITIDGGTNRVFVHSMFLVTDRTGLELLMRNGIFTDNDNDVSKDDVVYGREVRTSEIILTNGFDIDCLAMPHSKQSLQQLRNSPFGNLWIPGTYYDGSTLEPLDVVFFKTNRGCSSMALERSMRLADHKRRRLHD